MTSPKLNLATMVICSSVILSGCANTASGYSPIVDGPQGDAYYADLSDCQSLAKTKRYDNGDTKTSALVGAVAGAAIGGIEDDSIEGAVAGALLGGLLGGAHGASETRTERKEIVKRCMYGRGYAVVG